MFPYQNDILLHSRRIDAKRDYIIILNKFAKYFDIPEHQMGERKGSRIKKVYKLRCPQARTFPQRNPHAQ